MKLLLIGLLAVLLVCGLQTRAERDDLTNGEIQEAEARANKTSASDKKICEGVCAEFEGDDLEKCMDACEVDTSRQIAGDDGGDDKGSPKRKRFVRVRVRVSPPTVRARIRIGGKKKRSVEVPEA
ncbi:uncharacterized protein LOC127879192 [Dreissena polymorpha]|uniref:Uncharacterized protein n=1 Tax=Dreissena polymorpha TaxID=45954 RepID=A0A9D4HGI2_DREPO|nr:uncharacterized protein LOC127879192 [Dreissena polymorpha]KAH3831932.1 hypothetical protein DPMN_105204 [Dreissena polymorpha]